VSQRMLEMDDQLAALIASGWALYDIVLGASRGSAQLVPHLDEAHLQVDSLIFKGVHYGAHATLTSVGRTMVVSTLMPLHGGMCREVQDRYPRHRQCCHLRC
jgi:hypothetical protein